MKNIDEKSKQVHLAWLFLLVLTWFAITQFTPLLNKIYNFYSVNPWILAFFRMAFMLVVTWAYVSFVEKKTFSEGFNIFFKDFGRNLLWAVVFFALWHYPYWRMGSLPGSLLIILTFIAGSIISLNYMKTKNTLSSALCHIFVDSPSAIKILLGK